MGDKTGDRWGELPNKKGEIQSERVLRKLMDLTPQPEQMQVVNISERAKSLANGHKAIQLIKPSIKGVAGDLSAEQALAYQQRLEFEAIRLVQAVPLEKKKAGSSRVIRLIEER